MFLAFRDTLVNLHYCTEIFAADKDNEQFNKLHPGKFGIILNFVGDKSMVEVFKTEEERQLRYNDIKYFILKKGNEKC